jgi:hypothetical protein
VASNGNDAPTTKDVNKILLDAKLKWKENILLEYRGARGKEIVYSLNITINFNK